jgi:hypothetical protein
VVAPNHDGERLLVARPKPLEQVGLLGAHAAKRTGAVRAWAVRRATYDQSSNGSLICSPRRNPGSSLGS